ncbi:MULTISPECIES: glycerol-3-phosphate dehydrogenase/oxidase [Flagellimonas]|uniref:Glycerol-3-phosphate dehydrogenase/oxidase n=2 Tax=Flagellimonas TaxID=444459 RepID=A0A3A1NJ34_9FLAO|nr:MULTISPECIES: glycerol-3-phosphate dehydrogenase/oxidase [Allomuricauda]MBW8242808.1 glycerol-3-phosphate dehydrogenase/oxidase [Allomuricauda oceani]QII45458.1 glycerol-3-phosphate dehydrogenase/oxidase [Allomuricauda oceani]RIV42406.1 glycerol-3-phosphate dehydrogenase/oxidase [Allomuricauda maritima]TXJ91436.1 glycerol-3-phosphate dehydrogenase/oxidase [Allomuricauda maritima]|tara:strand:+ start:4441 stop:6009 length:1569 start_codon:yes stop_codon:yes gene_type:complete
MDRKFMVKKLEQHIDEVWDIVVIGGGATGLGAALDAASRGYKTLLLEQADFAKGTSSRSTKLVHGGVRYLAQGDISLVLEALHERGLLKQNAPHLVNDQEFIIPNYEWWGGPFYTVGLKVYDMMAGKLGLGPSVHITKEETLKAIPNLKKKGLHGGVIYHDGQFDDSRLAINLAQTIVNNNGIVLNYMKVTQLLKNNIQLVNGVMAIDQETGKEYKINAKAVINATGVFADDILKMDDANARKTIVPSQGVHIVLEKEFLLGDSAIMIPKTDDGRVLFAVPWHDKVVVGTTDTLISKPALEPRALKDEIEFILNTASKYLTRAPSRKDVLCIFAGLRPLAAPEDEGKSTKEISRSHKISISLSGLVTITGGKWTTYRRMGEDTIDKASMVAGLDERPSVTKNMPIHGSVQHLEEDDDLRFYGTDRLRILKLVNSNPSLGEKLHPKLNFIKAEVVWAVREEMARNIEDVLARRVRALFLDARASIEMAPEVARLIAAELDWDDAKVSREIEAYKELAKGYILD